MMLKNKFDPESLKRKTDAELVSELLQHLFVPWSKRATNDHAGHIREIKFRFQQRSDPKSYWASQLGYPCAVLDFDQFKDESKSVRIRIRHVFDNLLS
ncbi:MAG: hypothetical protein V4469_03250 [Patescibacteria group bacterium]